ncbi:MAG: nucleotide exchange factor GrpE [Treponema sp.]|jgi:molecular chaperone GrpE (heat shock protein)|nr:nucleotide exchange factor GrpE [Treponema sp.]
MLNFEAELDKLLSREIQDLPQYEFAELAAAGQTLLAEFNKKQTDVSLQVEEIYDLVKEQELLQDTAKAERNRANQLIQAAIGLGDLLEDFYVYARRSGDEALKHQAGLLWEQAGGILAGLGITRFGESGQFLDPRIHTVKASAESSLPRECIVEALQSGYAYQNALIRKAAVVVSRGPEYGTTDNGTQNQDTQDQDNEGEPCDE